MRTTQKDNMNLIEEIDDTINKYYRTTNRTGKNGFYYGSKCSYFEPLNFVPLIVHAGEAIKTLEETLNFTHHHNDPMARLIGIGASNAISKLKDKGEMELIGILNPKFNNPFCEFIVVDYKDVCRLAAENHQITFQEISKEEYDKGVEANNKKYEADRQKYEQKKLQEEQDFQRRFNRINDKPESSGYTSIIIFVGLILIALTLAS